MAEELTPEQQIEALNKQVADLKTKSDQKDATIKDQKGKVESQGKDLAQMTKDLTQVTKERDQAVQQRDGFKNDVAQKVERIRELEGEAEANEQVIASLELSQRVAEAAGDGTTVVTHDEKLYRVLVPQFQFEGQVVKAEALATDATLVAKLLAAGSGVLELVESKG